VQQLHHVGDKASAGDRPVGDEQDCVDNKTFNSWKTFKTQSDKVFHIYYHAMPA